MSRYNSTVVTLLILLTGAGAPVFAQGWSTEIVVPFGNYADLAVDDAGHPHIVFTNCTLWEGCDPVTPGNSELIYSTNDGSGWSFETIANDPGGFLTSIVIDSFGEPHVAYCDSNYHMHYGYRNAGVWTIEDLHHPHPTGYRASPSLTLDASDEPHIAFIERETIHYARKVGGLWTDEDVTYSWLDNWSARAAIAIDSTGTPLIGSWEYYESAVLYTRGATEWSSDYIGGSAGYNPWMVLDDNDAAHFVYQGSVYATNAGGSWVEEVIDPQGSNEPNDIALDASGRPFIVYTRSVLITQTLPWLWDIELYVARRDTTGWSTDLIASADSVIQPNTTPRIEIDDNETIHVLYRDPETSAIRYGTHPVPTAANYTRANPVSNAITGIIPNPFNPSAEITFRLENGERIILAVYDVAGRPVRVLADTVLPVGDHTVRWDGITESGITAPSGVYFFRLKTANGIYTKHAVLAK